MDLLKHTALDAKYIGCDIPFCRSMEIFPSRSRWHFDSVMIDELDRVANSKRGIKGIQVDPVSPVDFGAIQIDNLLRESSESSL